MDALETLLLDGAIKVLWLLALAWIVVLSLRRAPAATRHLIWVCALCGALILPLSSLVLPPW